MALQLSHKTILFLSANPENTTCLRLSEEQREIESGLERSKYRDNFKFIPKVAVRRRDLQQAILDHEPQIVHFSGHGEGESGLVLENDNGEYSLVETEPLANLFKLFKDKIECVILNACYSEEQAKAIVRYIPFVIGMSDAIDDRVAIIFASAFYDALGAGKDIEFAYRIGINAIENRLSATVLDKNENVFLLKLIDISEKIM